MNNKKKKVHPEWNTTAKAMLPELLNFELNVSENIIYCFNKCTYIRM